MQSLNRSMLYLVYTEVETGAPFVMDSFSIGKNQNSLKIFLALTTVVAPLLLMVVCVFVVPAPLG